VGAAARDRAATRWDHEIALSEDGGTELETALQAVALRSAKSRGAAAEDRAAAAEGRARAATDREKAAHDRVQAARERP
jgi:hypothetical protein